MKPKEAPEKIYLTSDEKNSYVFTQKRSDNMGIEYVRTDAFIEKTLSWLKNHYRDYMYNPTGKRLEAFFGGDMCNDFEDFIKEEL